VESNAKAVGQDLQSADALAAHAMNRVLESEREAQAAIAEQERHCSEQLEQARQKRRALLEHAQARIVALHTRAAKALQQRATAIAEQAARSEQNSAPEPGSAERWDGAIRRLLERLTTP
jgi:hypothetical protein